MLYFPDVAVFLIFIYVLAEEHFKPSVKRSEITEK